MSNGSLSVLLAGVNESGGSGAGDDPDPPDSEDPESSESAEEDVVDEGEAPAPSQADQAADATAKDGNEDSQPTEETDNEGSNAGEEPDTDTGEMSQQEDPEAQEADDGGEPVGRETPPETRQARATAAVGYDGQDETALDGFRNGDNGEGELGVRVADFEDAYPLPVENELAAKQARNVSNLVAKPMDDDRAARVADTARKHAAADVAPSAFVASYAPGIEALVTDAFSALVEGESPDAVAERLQAGLRAALVDMQVGVDEFAETAAIAPLATDDYTEELTMAEVFESIPNPAFLIDDENTLLEYNVGINRLLGVADDHREWLGGDNRETIAAATYTDGSRHNSLADKVAQNPRDADQAWDVDRVDGDNEYTDHIVYEDTSVSKNTAGEETHIAFLAVPFFDDDGDLKGVFELVEDRSEEVLHQKSVQELVGEVTGTLHEIGDGDLSARAHYEDDHGVITPKLLELTTDVNEMAENFEQLVDRVGRKTEDLSESIARTTNSAHEISEQATTQHESLEEVAEEMEDFSATMQEVAASSNQVASAAEAALEAADEGVESGQDARDVTSEVMEISDDLVDTVEQLDEYMGEIGEVVEVISEVADQTNMLALNANIEAARAGEAGSGFAVVADEVKNLANETQEHTEEIADRIELIQEQADETVDEVEATNERVQDAETEIQNALEALETISEKVSEAADGIHEVANANDEQAATVEEVMATIDDVRDRSQEVAESTETIVHETEKQESAVFELSDRVHELSTASEGDDLDVDHEHEHD